MPLDPPCILAHAGETIGDANGDRWMGGTAGSRLVRFAKQETYTKFSKAKRL